MTPAAFHMAVIALAARLEAAATELWDDLEPDDIQGIVLQALDIYEEDESVVRADLRAFIYPETAPFSKFGTRWDGDHRIPDPGTLIPLEDGTLKRVPSNPEQTAYSRHAPE